MPVENTSRITAVPTLFYGLCDADGVSVYNGNNRFLSVHGDCRGLKTACYPTPSAFRPHDDHALHLASSILAFRRNKASMFGPFISSLVSAHIVSAALSFKLMPDKALLIYKQLKKRSEWSMHCRSPTSVSSAFIRLDNITNLPDVTDCSAFSCLVISCAIPNFGARLFRDVIVPMSLPHFASASCLRQTSLVSSAVVSILRL